jgi:hypothetical protein
VEGTWWGGGVRAGRHGRSAARVVQVALAELTRRRGGRRSQAERRSGLANRAGKASRRRQRDGDGGLPCDRMRCARPDARRRRPLKPLCRGPLHGEGTDDRWAILGAARPHPDASTRFGLLDQLPTSALAGRRYRAAGRSGPTSLPGARHLTRRPQAPARGWHGVGSPMPPLFHLFDEGATPRQAAFVSAPDNCP